MRQRVQPAFGLTTAVALVCVVALPRTGLAQERILTAPVPSEISAPEDLIQSSLQEALIQSALPTQPNLGTSPPANPVASSVASPVASPAVGVSVPVPPADPLLLDVLGKDLSDLTAMLTGRWDNELQTFFEPELNVPPERRHDRIHAFVRPLTGTDFGTAAFYVEYRQGGEVGNVVRQRIWAFSVDGAVNGVRMATFAPKDAKPLEGAWADEARLATLKKADFTAIQGCDLVWRRRADGFSGETRPAACKMASTTDQRVLTVTERHDLSAAVWEVRDIGVDARGVRVFGAPDAVPTRLRRATTFVCWVGVAKGTERLVQSEIVLQDQGGLAAVSLPGGRPDKVRIRLRNVDWPIGVNRPSLTLYVLLDDDERAEGYAWGEPTAPRLALDIGGTQVSCTRDEAAVWRAPRP